MKFEEDKIQKAICEYLDIRGVCYWAVPNGGARSKVEGAKLKATGTKSGVPDLTVVYDGLYYGLEIKRPADSTHPKGYLSKNQKSMISSIKNAGGEVEVVYSVADVILWLNTKLNYETERNY